MKVTTTIIPRYHETDKMGIIHHAVYPVWFEIGRTDYCNEIGLPYHLIEEQGITQALVNLEVKYKMPSKYGDKLTLITYVKNFNGLTIDFEYKLYNEDSKLITIGTTRNAWLDGTSLQLNNIKKTHPNIYALLEEHFDKNDSL